MFSEKTSREVWVAISASCRLVQEFCINLGIDGNCSIHLMIQVVPFKNSLKSGSVAMDSARTSAVPGYRQKGETVQATRELEESTKNLWPLEQRGEVKMCCHVDDRQKSCRFRAGEVL